MRLVRLICEPRHLPRLFPGLARRAGSRGSADLLAWLRRRALLRALLCAGATLLIVVSLLGPVRGFALVPVATRQIDVVVALDTSRSMLVEDVTPNRLERAKAEIGALFEAIQGERVALVAFAGLARNVTPLTRDVETAQFFLQRLSPEDNRKGGTDLAAALRLALERFEPENGANQAVVLVTDGEDLTGEGLAAAQEAAKRGIRVHVLGMGTPGGGKVPDGVGGFVVDPEADGGPQEVVSRLESSSLKAIASATGGIYLEAKGRVLPLEELYRRAIASMEGRDIVDGKERVPRDRFQWTLALAFLLLVLEGSWRETKE
jgi:Ca-activated chloride channel family protein